MIQRGFKYRLYATTEQQAQFRRFAGVCRAVYNAALFQREHFWRRARPSYTSQCRELTELRAEFDWIAAVSQTCQQQALRDLDRAFRNFFEGVARYPRPRRKRDNDSFRFHGRECTVRRLNRNWGAVHLPKIGEVRFRWTREIDGTVKNVTVSCDALGWHVTFACEIEQDAIPVGEEPCVPAGAVGIDRGVANSIALSTGELPPFPVERINILARRHRKAQKALSRRRRGSKRRTKAVRRAAAIKAQAGRLRRHWNHVQTARIVRRFATVCIEDLKTRNMTASARGTVEKPGRNVRAKAGLNRVILDRGWRQFETLLSYKLAAAEGGLIKVDPRNTSRRCAKCGHVDARNRESQAIFCCVACGHEAHADVNAARNILDAGLRRRPAGTRRLDRARALASRNLAGPPERRCAKIPVLQGGEDVKEFIALWRSVVSITTACDATKQA